MFLGVNHKVSSVNYLFCIALGIKSTPVQMAIFKARPHPQTQHLQDGGRHNSEMKIPEEKWSAGCEN